jgi:spore germination cell wall hydrolase CwlJ-like protein
MVKIVRVFLALFATLWYTTSQVNSNASVTLQKNWEFDLDRILNQKSVNVTAKDYYQTPEPTTRYSLKDVDCLAKNIYFEAGVESTAGKLAVANVTINRKLNKSYPNTICGVVQEGIHYYSAKLNDHVPVRDRCQFSWYCDGRLDIPNEGRTWNSAQALAVKVLDSHYEDKLIDITDGATHYHANWMETYPTWSKQKKIMASIDRHIFYRKH